MFNKPTHKYVDGTFYVKVEGPKQYKNGDLTYVWYLWQPVKKYFGLIWLKIGAPFWLDDYGFEEIK